MMEVLFSQFWIQRLGWTLLHFLWQGTAIAAAYALLRGLLRGSLGSEGRYVLACLALAAMTITPAVTFLLLPRGADVLTMPWRISASAWQQILPSFVAVWMAGVLAFSIRLYGGWRFTARLRATSHPAPSEWQATLDRMGARVGNSRPVSLLISSLVDVPTVIGWLRPVILFPVSALTGLPPEHVEALLAHEVAHIRRHDYLASVLQSVAEAVLFYHPAVWWVSRQIRAEREMCCDDLAVVASGDVLIYASALAQLESIQPQRMKPALAANGGSLVNRIRRLVEPSQPEADNLPGAGAAWAMTLLWLAGVGVVTVHAAQTPTPMPPVVRMGWISRAAAPSPFSPLPATVASTENLIAHHVRETMLFDPFLSAQAIQPQARGGAVGDKAASAWSDWLDGDVAEIITREERTAFLELKTDEEREHFVEQFWLVRDPTPNTFLNEFKDEHYRRIAYANEHFGWTSPGVKTDRGRVYVRYGPPDEIESHSGGTQQPFAVEDWRYRFIEGFGNNVVIEFADTAGSGEIHLAAGQPDVLRNSSDNSNSSAVQQELAEINTSIERTQFTLQYWRQQYTDTYPTVVNMMKQLELMESKRDALMMKARENAFALAAQRAASTEPSVRFQDLEAQALTRTNANGLPMQVRYDYLRGPGSTVIVNITIQFENRDLQFQQVAGVEKSIVNIFGRITSMTRRPISTFEPTLQTVAPLDKLENYKNLKQSYQQSIPLLPGRYLLNLVAKDMMSGNVNVYEVALDVPHDFDGNLAASSLILADTIEKLPARQIGGSMFAIGDTKVRPRVGNTFSGAEKMGVYLQVYNLTPDAVTQKPIGSVEYEVDIPQSGAKVLDVFQDLGTVEYASASQVTLQKLLPLTTFAPGNYTLKVTVHDRNGHQTVQRQENFTVSPQ